MTLGEKIRELRKASGLSQEQLAEKLEVSRQAVSKWETGSCAPDIEKLTILSDLFCVSLDQLVRDKVIENSNVIKVNFEEIAKQNWYRRKMTILIIVGMVSIMLSVVLGAIIYTLNKITTDIEYILYRYIAVGEWANLSTGHSDYTFPFTLAIILLAIGCIAVALGLIEKIKRK